MSNRYIDEIISYLEHKYNDKFCLNKAIRNIEIAEADVVLAQCFSEKYPNEFFDVIYHLSSDDIYKKEEVIAALNEKGFKFDETIYSQSEDKSTPYFEDNYINIIKQHEFDDLCAVPRCVKIISRIDTFNYYPTLNDNQLSLENYFQNIKNKIMLKNYIFVPSGVDFNEDECVATVANKLVSRQFICIIYTNNKIDECVKTYYKNYTFPYEVLKKSETTTSIKFFKLNSGRLIDKGGVQ